MSWLNLFLIISAVFLVRYFVVVGGAYWYFWKHRKAQSEAKKIQKEPFKKADIQREIKYSILSSFIMAAIAALVRSEPLIPYVKIYKNVADYGWPWFFASIVFLVIFHDTYFYWMHRFAHKASVYKIVHKIHHDSRNPTPFAAFSFHPIEAVLEIIWMPILHLFVPFNTGAMLIFSVITLLMNIMGHLGIELYPESWANHPVFKYLNHSANHNDHHKYFKNNYSLYFTWWDRTMGTFTPHEVHVKKQNKAVSEAPDIDLSSSLA